MRTRGHFLAELRRDEFDPSVASLSVEIDYYVGRVGLPQYLSQMLGDAATAPMARCVLGWPDGRIFAGRLWRRPEQQLQRYIRYECGRLDLPYVVEVHLGGGHVAVRYL